LKDQPHPAKVFADSFDREGMLFKRPISGTESEVPIKEIHIDSSELVAVASCKVGLAALS
jgi:hypothetical protein